MRFLLNPWPWFALAAVIAVDYATANVFGRITAGLLMRVVNVLPG